MATTTTSKPRPTTRPKPRGANVRAFIETVEKGAKPQPDFFNSDSVVTPKRERTVKAGRAGTSHTRVKPPVLHKKPSLPHGRTEAKKKSVRARPSCQPPPPPLAGKEVDAQSTEEYDTISEINCPSEDSGLSTCDLKYSGSISSTQSSSHDPNYQTFSELDDGYSEHTTGTVTGTSTTTEGTSTSTLHGEYCLASEVTSPGSTMSHSRPPPASNRNHSRTYQSAYKYHVPGRLTGTLPRDRKKAAFIGKAVAKGRNTLKKKPSGEKTEDSGTLKSYKSVKSSLTDSMNQSELDFSDSDFDTDFLSDSEWETDGEQSANPADNLNPSVTSAASGQGDTKISNRLSVHSKDENLYEGIDLPSPTSRPYTTEGRSKFYNLEEERENNKQLVHIMRNNSSRKENKTRLKKRLNNIKGNIMDSKFVQSSNSKLAAMKTFLNNKLKKPSVPKPDYRGGVAIDNQEYAAGSQLSLDKEQSVTDSQSDLHSVSSHNSNSTYQLASSLADSPITHLIPRQQPVQQDVRAKTQSLGAVLDVPPLPPRVTTRSQFIPKSVELDYLPPPPPPIRTTSRGLETGLTADDMASSSSQPVSRKSSQSSIGGKLKPQVAPRSPKILHSSMPEEMFDEPAPPLPDRPKTQKLSYPEIGLHQINSASALGNRVGEDNSTSLPVGRQSSTSLVVTSDEQHAEAMRHRDVILSGENNNKSSFRADRKVSSPTAANTVSPSKLKVSVPAPSQSKHEGGGEEGYVSVRDSGLIEEEPLYQEYHECMISTVKRKYVRKTSTLMKGGQPTNSLWSTTPAVLSSGVLDQMNSEEIKLQEAMFEVVTSEASYLRSLNMLNKVFVNSSQFCNEDILSARDKKELFSNIAAVTDVSTRLFTELEEHWKGNVILTAVCDIISKYAYKEFDVYIKYCSNQAYQDRTIKRLLSTNTGFQEALSVLEKSPECHGLSMSSFLLLPMQRVTRLPLLLDAVQRRMGITSDQYRSAQECYELMKKVVSKCNEGARKMEQTEQVLSIENKLQFNKLRKIPLTSASRRLIKKGDLIYFCADGNRTANLLSLKPKTLSLFLFNDLLVVTKKKGEYYTVLDYGARVNVEIEEWASANLKDSRLNVMAQKSQAKFLFMLVLLENHQKKHAEFLLSCHTETERTRWAEAFTSPAQSDDCDDKIYEAWDCPQVQVTHKYVAQQPDELNLDTGDVINVLRKTTDGWYEGERVSDGQTGWIPSSYTLELQNDHVKARHLKERYKLLQAAAKIMK